MHIALAAAVLLAATAEAPDDAEIAKGLRNLAQIHSVGQVMQLRKIARVERSLDIPRDPWGTRYKIEGDRIVSAGSDRQFQLTELANQQFAGLDGDLVFADGRMFRSNRNWLFAHVQAGADSAAALLQLRTVELQHMLLHLPAMQNLMLSRLTAQEMLRPGAAKDGWGTALMIEGTRIVSAGADLQFDPVTWDKPATLDLKEDIIVEGGKVTRVVDPRAFLAANQPEGVAVPQPPDEKITDVAWARAGGDVKAPAALERVEPVYSPDYRRARISGIVILESAISATGVVEEVRLLKSCAPDLDMAAVEAVRKWKFAPGTRDGVAIPVIFNVTINFRMK